jgi:hypothetical protein
VQQAVIDRRVWSLTRDLGADDVDVLDGRRPSEQVRSCRAQRAAIGVQVSLTAALVGGRVADTEAAHHADAMAQYMPGYFATGAIKPETPVAAARR